MAGSQQLTVLTAGRHAQNTAETSSTSSHTDSSNTLTFSTPIMTAPPPPFPFAFPPGASTASNPGSYPALLGALRAPGLTARHVFLQPTALLPAESLQLVKETLEGFAGSLSDLQLERLRAANKNKKKRKRDGAQDDGAGGKQEVLKIRKVVVDGFATGQVWQQAKRIIGSALEFSERAVEELEQRNGIARVGADDVDEEEEGEVDEADFEEFGSEEDLEEDGEQGDSEDNEDNHEDLDAEEREDEGEYDDEPEEYVEDPNGLNDGFFSIEDFNRLSQWFEDQDARGDPNTDQNSDDEDIDWGTDPLAAPTKGAKGAKPAKPVKNGKKSKLHNIFDPNKDDDLPPGLDEDGIDAEHHDDNDDDSEEDGPTFPDMDLYAPEGASDDEADDLALNGRGGVDSDGDDDELNANEVYYKDFFAPPPRKARDDGTGRRKTGRPSHLPPDAADIERAMRNVRHNLYDDLSEQEASGGEDDPGALSDVSAGDPRSRRSAHERRQAKIADEIRRLEAELVAKRAWTLSGEAMAAERPVNSLLEENLDFEHAGRPVPVITTEVTESLEELIKRRIIAHEFDEVLRRRPDAGTVPASTRCGLVAIDDAKSTKGLAEVYEEEHVKAANPDAYVSASDEKLRAEERDVERLWREVCGKLDALASWNYRPKNPEANVTVVADVAAISMEDAQPSTANGIAAAAESVLAPQEVYRPGADDTTAAASDVHRAKSGMPAARAELSREEKTRRRRRDKERQSKAGAGWKSAAETQRRRDAGEKESKGDTVAQLRKGGVAVINKKGELVGVDGKKAKAPRGMTASNYKL